MITPEPMSDRRTIVLVLALLTALLGAAVTIIASIRLQDPVSISGELGTRVEIGGELLAAIVLGVSMLVGGIGVAAVLVRAQLRAARR